MQVIEINAYAKVNLSLDIVGRREDGYHTVDMVMQSVSLCDRVRVALNDSGQIRLTCSKPHIPEDGRNTAFKAAQLFLDVTGLPFGAEIHIEKHIPDEAGLGGGSADAAAVLRAMNRLCAEVLGRSRSIRRSCCTSACASERTCPSASRTARGAAGASAR